MSGRSFRNGFRGGIRRRVGGLVLVLGVLLVIPVPEPDAGGADRAAAEALRAGNRQLRRGDAAGAVEAYLGAGDAVVRHDPALAYNLATAYHLLGKLPEAVLWYRRAEFRLGDDPWLRDNLDAARNTLAAPRLPPRPPLTPVLVHRWFVPAAAAASAWAALLLAVLAARPGRRDRRLSLWATLPLATGALLWCLHLGLTRLGPQPAVLLEPCSATLPAGSEVWTGRASSRETVTVHGPEGPVACPAGAVEPL